MDINDIHIGIRVDCADGNFGVVKQIGESGMHAGEKWYIPDRICVDCTGSMDNPPDWWFPIRWYFPRELTLKPVPIKHVYFDEASNIVYILDEPSTANVGRPIGFIDTLPERPMFLVATLLTHAGFHYKTGITIKYTAPENPRVVD